VLLSHIKHAQALLRKTQIFLMNAQEKEREIECQAITVILDEAEAGALACLQGPIYAYRRPANYPTRETCSQNY
jgi:hypothetical protein